MQTMRTLVMANEQNKFHIINNVKARYPKMDKPYRFDTTLDTTATGGGT